MARSEMSAPVTLAPRLAQESVSSPKRHWRWSRSLAATRGSMVGAWHVAGPGARAFAPAGVARWGEATSRESEPG
jgi:hypothetical protein